MKRTALIFLMIIFFLLSGCSGEENEPLPTPNAGQQLRIEKLEEALNGRAADGEFSGAVLITQDGVILINQGYGLADQAQEIENTPQTRFRLASVSKPFTALAVLILEEQGKLSLDDGVCTYVPDCPSAWEVIKIRDLLAHTSGIPDYATLPDFEGKKDQPAEPEALLNRFKDLPLDFPFGGEWWYSSSNYVLLGLVIEQASGMPYADFMVESIFEPLGMENTGYEPGSQAELAIGYRDGSSQQESDSFDASSIYAAGGLYSTLEDLHIWTRALDAGTLVSPEKLEMAMSEQAAIPGIDELAYGYGWFIEKKPERLSQMHWGEVDGFRAQVSHYPAEGVWIVVLSNQETLDVQIFENDLAGIIFEE